LLGQQPFPEPLELVGVHRPEWHRWSGLQLEPGLRRETGPRWFHFILHIVITFFSLVKKQKTRNCRGNRGFLKIVSIKLEIHAHVAKMTGIALPGGQTATYGSVHRNHILVKHGFHFLSPHRKPDPGCLVKTNFLANSPLSGLVATGGSATFLLKS
jgi:hypothetical protein